MPSSPFNISSVTLTERFAPLIGVNFTLKNELQFNAEYRDQRTLTLNSSAAQVVEASTRGIKFGMGYKIVGFNTVLKMRGSQQGISNDLTLNAEVGINRTQALIRKIRAHIQPIPVQTVLISISPHLTFCQSVLPSRPTLTTRSTPPSSPPAHIPQPIHPTACR